jgi:hypothetical protein
MCWESCGFTPMVQWFPGSNSRFGVPSVSFPHGNTNVQTADCLLTVGSRGSHRKSAAPSYTYRECQVTDRYQHARETLCVYSAARRSSRSCGSQPYHDESPIDYAI